MERFGKYRIVRRLSGRKEIYLLLVILAICLGVSLGNASFATLENILDILRSSSFLGILAIGMLVVLLSGGIDLSLMANATVAQYLMAVFIQRYPHMNVAVTVAIPLVVGTALGSINAALIYFLNAPPIIVTISTMNVFYGILQLVSGGRWIVGFPAWFNHLSALNVFFIAKGGASYGVSLITIVWLGISLVTLIGLKYAIVGREVYALGGNREAARRAGVNILVVQLFVYCFMGFLSGLAAIVQALLALAVAPNSLVGRELEVIAAVVLGGASLSGGFGTVLGTLLGVVLVSVIGNGLVLMKVSSFWHETFLGLIILLSVSVTAIQQRAFRKRTSKIDVQ